MGRIQYAIRDGRLVLADGCCVTGSDGVEKMFSDRSRKIQSRSLKRQIIMI